MHASDWSHPTNYFDKALRLLTENERRGETEYKITIRGPSNKGETHCEESQVEPRESRAECHDRSFSASQSIIDV